MSEKRERSQLFEGGIVGEVAVSTHLTYQLQLFEVLDADGHTWRYQIDDNDAVGPFANKYDAWRAAAVVLAAMIGG